MNNYAPLERIRFGIYPGFVRVSPGLEEAEDLIADFEQAIAQIDGNVNETLADLGEGSAEWKPTITTME